MTGVGNSDGTSNDVAAPPPVPLPLPPTTKKRGRKPKPGGAVALAQAAAARAAAAAAVVAAASQEKNSDNDNVEMKDVHDNTSHEDEYKIKSAFMNRGYIQLPGFGDHKRAVSSVKFANSRLTKRSAIVASSSADGSIKLWDVQEAFISNNTGAGNNSGNSSKIHRRHSNDNDNTTATTTDAGQPTTISSSNTTATARRNSTGGNNNNVNVSSSFIVSSGNNNDNTSKNNKNNSSSNTKPMEPILQCMGHSRGINEIAWNPVAPLLASASDDKTIRLWDVITGDALVEYRGHDNFVFCVDQHQHMLVSGSFDETVKLWDIRSGDCVSTLPAHSDPVTSVSFNRDGTVVCSASHDGLIRLWDVATGECLKTIYATGNPPVCSAKFSPNSHYILGATLLDATLRLWPVHRTGSNQCAKTYKCPEYHTNTKFSIVADFTCHGDIVTGSETGHVLVYDLQTGKAQQPKTLSSPSSVSWSSSAAAAAAAATKQQQSSGDAGATLEKDSSDKQQQQQKAEQQHAEIVKHFAVPPAHEDAVLAVSAHDRYPLLASGAMTADRKVIFWGPDDPSYTIPKTKHDNLLSSFF